MYSLDNYPSLFFSAPLTSTLWPPSCTVPLSRAHNAQANARRPFTSSPPGECRACGVPLTVFRKCRNIQLGDMTAHLCITTYRSPDNSVLKLELCFVGQDCQRIPSILGATYGMQTKRLDLSYNAIRTLDGLERFPFLEELVLDNNYLDDTITLPYIETLHTLSLNKNKLINLDNLLVQARDQLPNLRYLSLLGNVACPDQLSSSDMDEKDYVRYRLYVLYHLPKLKFLDSTRVRRSELKEAQKRGHLSKVVRPGIDSVQSSIGATDDHTDGIEAGLRAWRSSSAPPGKESRNGTTSSHESLDSSPSTRRSGAYGFRRFRYLGHNSEGNRFIGDQHL